MKKFLLLLITILIVQVITVNAQQGKYIAKPARKLASSLTAKPQGVCDTANLAELAPLDAVTYIYSTDGVTTDGFIFGANGVPSFTIKENANYFDLSASSYNYITGAYIYFSVANTNVASDFSKVVNFKLYNANATAPGSQFGVTVSKTLAELKQDVDNEQFTYVAFPTPVALPASKKFYLSADISSMVWVTEGDQDSIAIVSTSDDETANTAYQKLKISFLTQWQAANQVWGDGTNNLDVALFMFPLVSADEAGCAVLPVSILNFAASIKNNAADLSWRTAIESNNKGFEIERSSDGRNFSKIGFVAGAGNSTAIQQYSFTDINMKDIKSNTVYYRLKQVDIDGKFNYSHVLPLKLSGMAGWNIYPNPINSNTAIQLQLTETGHVNIQVMNAQGQLIRSMDKGILQAGTQTLPLNLQNLLKGVYFVKLIINDKVAGTQVITK